MPGTLFVVATPIGNLEDVTFRAVRVLREAGLIAAEDTRRTATLLARHDIRTPTTSFHEHNERQKIPLLLEKLSAGVHVAIVTDAGTPGISDPGFRLVRAAVELGARVEAVPGPSAVIAALVASGLPTDSFTFLGFPPARGHERQRWLTSLVGERRTCVFFEAPHRLRATLEALEAGLGDRQIAVGRELTKIHEEVLRGTVSDVLGHLPNPRGEFTVVVAPAVGGPTRPANIEDDDVLAAFSQEIEREQFSRRQAVGSVARKLGLSAKSVYEAIERAKKARAAS